MSVNQHDGDDPFIGQVLDGKYRIDTLLGVGGMGAVYRATHILMDHPCAVKVLHSSMMADPSAVPRFQREARAAARIRHQNAIAVSDFGITGENVVYLVMEFFPGRSLRQILKDEGALSIERTARIVDCVAAALDAAHRQGIIHRDVKPDNIMLRQLPGGEEEVKVLDFGIAKIVDQHALHESLTITGTIIGTPHYLSPEQCRAASDLDARSDLYSLGIVTHEMLTGAVPFLAATPIAVAMMHITDPPPSITDKVPNLPMAAEAAVHRALAKKREDRQNSVLEYAQQFYSAVFGSMPPRSGGTSYMTNTPPGYYPGTDMLIQDGQATVAFNPPSNTGQTARPTPSSGVGFRTPGGGIRPMSSGAGQPAVSEHTVVSGAMPMPQLEPEPPTQLFRGEVVPEKRSSMMLYAALATVLVIVLGVAAAYFAGVFKRAEPTPDPGKPVAGGPTTSSPETPPPGMVLIPGGTFMMGRDSKDVYEGPPHEVTVKPFFLDKTEVTNKQYAEFVLATGYTPPPDWVNGNYKVGTADLPVVNVEWADARAYAEWAKKRLPTEAEWEYAARGTENRLYPWGNDWIPGLAYTKESGLKNLQPVGSSPDGASPFGILDMSGNVWEWCQDNFSPYPGSNAEPKDVTFKIIRGGSLGDEKEKAMATYRNWVPPERKYEALGFRCAKSVE